MALTDNFKDYIQDAIADMDIERKFHALTVLEDTLLEVRQQLAEEWTYCCGCHMYVRCDERVKDSTEYEDRVLIRCGSCGAVHYVRGKEE